MLCLRCSHPLKSHADRCVRCFALNPQNVAAPLAGVVKSGPAAPRALELSIASDPPARPVALFFDDAPAGRGPALPRADITLPAPPSGLSAFAAAGAKDAGPDCSDFPAHEPVARTPAAAEPAVTEAEPAQAAPAASAQSYAKGLASARSAPRAADAVIASFLETLETPAVTEPAPPAARGAASPRPAAAARAIRPDAAVTEPAPATSLAPAVISAPPAARPLAVNSTAPAVSEPAFSVSAPAPAPSLSAPVRPSVRARALAFALDSFFLSAAVATHVAVALAIIGPPRLAPSGAASLDFWLDLLLARELRPLWLALAATLGVAYSFLFVALTARTPGLALTGQRLTTTSGAAPTPTAALLRAALSLPSAALALFGFALALVDPRGQTLHDKLSGCIAVADRT